MKRPIDWREDRSAVREKVAESARCVLPIVLIVVLLCLAAAPEQYGDFDIVELWEDAA